MLREEGFEGFVLFWAWQQGWKPEFPKPKNNPLKTWPSLTLYKGGILLVWRAF